MKHAMLLTAYNDFEVLGKIVNYYAKYWDCYIHIDKKVQIPSEFKEAMSLSNVFILRTRRINWGGVNHIKAFIDLMEIAAQKEYDYYHLLSGNAFIMQSPKQVDSFFESNPDKNYIEVLIEPNGYKERQELFFFPDIFNVKSKLGWKCHFYLCKLQQALGMKRKIRYTYKGYLYCHITQAFCRYVLEYIKRNKRYLLDLSTTFIPEEFFFQNIVMGSSFESTICNNCLIANDWENGENGGPATLKYEDVLRLKEDSKFYVRKIRDVKDVEKMIEDFTIQEKFK